MKTILLVEDSDADASLITAAIVDHYEIVRAKTGEEAVEIGKKLLPDLVLMDIILEAGKRNGFWATRELTRTKETAHIPVVILSSCQQETDRVWALRQGAKDFLSKPVDAARLLGTIKSCMESVGSSASAT